MMITLIVFLIQRFNLLLQGSDLFVACLHHFLQVLLSHVKVGELLLTFIELCGDFLKQSGNERWNFLRHHF